MANLVLFTSRSEERALLESSIRQLGLRRSPLAILEAGCGRRWALDLGGLDYLLTGVDLDHKALDHRINQVKDLHHGIVADLRAVELEPGGYDVIFSSFVLEHVQGAVAVLDRFSDWLKPNGLMILRIPDRDSVYGLLTRLTPFWVHVAYKKYIVGYVDAGQPGHGPYPTFHDRVLSRPGILAYCRAHALIIKTERGHGFYIQGGGTIKRLTRLLARMLSALSFGRLAWRHSNLTYVIEKCG